MNTGLGHRVWLASAWGEARRFKRAASALAPAQTSQLAGYLAANASTAFGRRHGFARLASVADYQAAVPPSSFDDYADDVADIARGEAGVLTAEPVRLLEPTSGSAGPVKLVPYTARLQAEIRRAVGVWITDLYRNMPDLMNGRAYWSITPLGGGPAITAGGIPVGFERDSAYLGGVGRILESAVLAVPDMVKHVDDMDDFTYVTLRYLIAARDLRLMSVWNPTYLTMLLDALPRYRDRLVRDVATGRLTLAGKLSEPVSSALTRSLRPDPGHAAALAGSPRDAPGTPRAGWAADKGDVRVLWPRLALVSCWADGPAAGQAQALAKRLPGVVVQPKGLIATEAFVSLPLIGVDGAVLAARSHFFEFLPADGGAVRLAHELEVGRQYDVLVTTGGGLYRYRLGDRVQVTGHWHQLPCLRFTGRCDRVSDWYGEKLSEPFVAAVLADLAAEHDWAPRFALLAPDDTPPGFRYTLYLELPAAAWPAERLAAIGVDLDARLGAGFHYAWCRRLGQLQAARVMPVRDGAASYMTACRARGQRLGDIKLGALATTTGWGAWLAPGGAENEAGG